MKPSSILSNQIDTPSVFDQSLQVGNGLHVAKRSKALGPQVGQRLSRRMRDLDLTDRALAELSHLSQTTIHNLRHGQGGNYGIGTIADIAKALGVTPEWLAYGAGPGPDQ